MGFQRDGELGSRRRLAFAVDPVAEASCRNNQLAKKIRDTTLAPDRDRKNKSKLIVRAGAVKSATHPRSSEETDHSLRSSGDVAH